MWSIYGKYKSINWQWFHRHIDNNLLEIKKRINFEYIDEWIIVYYGNKMEFNPQIFQENNKIKEHVYKGQRYYHVTATKLCIQENHKSKYSIKLFEWP